MKDFYDIVSLCREFDFERDALQLALRATFGRRETTIPSANEILQSELPRNAAFERLWQTFKDRTQITVEEDF